MSTVPPNDHDHDARQRDHHDDVVDPAASQDGPDGAAEDPRTGGDSGSWDRAFDSAETTAHDDAEPVVRDGSDRDGSDRDGSDTMDRGGSAGVHGESATTTEARSSSSAAGDLESSGAATRTTPPTPEEDAAVRDERARRFGRPGADRDGSSDDRSTGATAAGVGAGAGVGAAAAGSDSTRTRPLGSSGTGTQPETKADAGTRRETTRADDDPFENWDDGPTSRAGAHWWGVLISLVLVPVAWYLLADGGERISHSLGTNVESVNVAGLIELGGGLLALIAVLLSARWSSVGAIIMGSIVTLVGAAFLVIPTRVLDVMGDQQETIDRLDQFGQNLNDHLIADGQSGRLLTYGIVLIFVGVVSHGARRQGRREERRKAAAAAAS